MRTYLGGVILWTQDGSYPTAPAFSENLGQVGPKGRAVVEA